MKILQTPTFDKCVKKLHKNQKKNLEQAIKKIAEKFEWAANMLFCILMFIIGTIFFVQTISFRTAALDISKGFIYVCLPIFAIVTIIFLINRLLD